MFSLIITILSIALVAGLALATLYYGGSAFTKGASEAEAAKILLQGQQILGASELFKSERGTWPKDIPELVSEGYLKSTPTAQEGVSSAYAAGGGWSTVLDYHPVYILPAVNKAVCKSINKKAYNLNGILSTPHSEYVHQCYGAEGGALTNIVSKEASQLLLAMPGPGLVTLGGAPADLTSAAWFDVPNTEGGDMSCIQSNDCPLLHTLDATEWDFGDQLVNSITVKTFRYTNTSLVAQQIEIGYESNVFPLESTCPSLLPAGGSCLLNASFKPDLAVPGQNDLKYVFVSRVWEDGRRRFEEATPVYLSGGASENGASVSVMPAAVAFGSVKIGEESLAQALTITNTGSVPTAVTRFENILNGVATAVEVVNCMALAPGASCILNSTFMPLGVGAFSASINVYVVGTTNPFSASATGVGTAVDPVATLRLSGVDRGQTKYGDFLFADAGAFELGDQPFDRDYMAVYPTIFEMVNLSDKTLNRTSGGGPRFGYGRQTPEDVQRTTCGPTLAPLASCVYSITLNSYDEGASIVVQYFDPKGIPVTLSTAVNFNYLDAVKVYGEFEGIETNQYDLGSVPAGSSQTRKVFVKNNLREPISFGVGGTKSNDNDTLSLINSCGPSLAPRSTCEIAFTLTSSLDATTRRVDGASGAAISVFLPFLIKSEAGMVQDVRVVTASSNPVGLVIDPAYRDFGQVPERTSVSQLFTLTNKSAVAANGVTLTFNLYAVMGAIPRLEPFTVSGNSCGEVLVAGASCQFYVTFFPREPVSGGNLFVTLNNEVLGTDNYVTFVDIGGTNGPAGAPSNNFEWVADAGVNLFEVFVDTPYSGGVCQGGGAGNPHTENVCTQNAAARALGKVCNLFPIENMPGSPGRYQTRISCS